MTWDDEDWGEEPSESYLQDASAIRPWQPGALGKGLITSDGRIAQVWAINEMGEPHHDDVAQEQGIDYVVKFDVWPSGAAHIPSPDDQNLFGVDRQTAEGWLAEEAPAWGLKFTPGFTSKRAARFWIDPESDADAVGTHVAGLDVVGNDWMTIAGFPTVGDIGTETGGQVDHQPDSVPHQDMASELHEWLKGFDAPTAAPPVTLHHDTLADMVPTPSPSPAEGHALDPPAHPYEPYDWATESTTAGGDV